MGKTIYKVSDSKDYKGLDLTTNVKGKTVSLTGKDIIIEIPGDKINPPKSRKISGATQAELKHYYEVDQSGKDGIIVKGEK